MGGKKLNQKKYAICFALLSATCSVNAMNNINVSPSGSSGAAWIYGDGADVIGGKSALGQTFSTGAGTDTQLKSMSFWVQADLDDPGLPSVKAALFKWEDGATGSTGRVVGEALYWSTLRQITTGAATRLVFDTNVNLNKSSKYIAFLTSLPVQDGDMDRLTLLTNDWVNNPNPINGEMFFTGWVDAANTSTLSSATWRHFADNSKKVDLAFSATFANPVPEPETYAMMLSGLGVVGWSLRKRKLAMH